MLFLSRKIDEKINIGTDSYVRFCGIHEGDALFVICDNGRMRTWSMILKGRPYCFSNGTKMKYEGWNMGQATIGFDAPDNILVLREEIDNYME